MMNRKAASIAMGVAIIAVLFGGWRFFYMRSPEYSIGQMRTALAEGNRLRFERYVDVPALADQAIEAVISRALMESVESSSSGFAILGASLGAGIIKQMQPAVAAALRTAILASVESGHLDSLFTDSDPSTDNDRNINLAAIGQAVAADRVRFEGTTDVEREGDLATIGFRFRSEPLDTTLVMLMRLQRSDARWRMVSFDNLEHYLEQVSELQENKLAEFNEGARKQLDSMVELGEFKPGRRDGIYGVFYYDVSISVTNISPDTITYLTVLVDGGRSDDDDDEITKILGRSLSNNPLSDDPPIPPGGTRVVTYRVLNTFQEDWYEDLLLFPANTFEPRVVLVEQNRNGQSIYTQTYETWQAYLAEAWSQ